jgi:type IV pilus assembly protein PilO
MPLKNRNLIISVAGLVLIAIVSYIFWNYAVVPVKHDQEADAKKLADLRVKLKSAHDVAGKLNQIQLEMAGLEIDVAQLEKQLPKSRELPALIRVVSHRAEANGVQIISFSPNKPVPKGLYDEIPYSMNIITSFHNLGRFLTAMGKGERLFAARNLTMVSNNSKTDPSKTITASFSLIAFKYHE